jgi:hypothetical protein
MISLFKSVFLTHSPQKLTEIDFVKLHKIVSVDLGRFKYPYTQTL